MDADGLVLRLLGSGKPVTPERIAKLSKHLKSLAEYDALCAALPEDVRALVTAQIGEQMTRTFRNG